MNQRFEALSRMCLNNWHYINKKTLSFHEGINFFTGHSGSGKSTVLDALQIVLYANTDGRAFFNKAAADDSDRSLLEYLRGMITIGENNEFSYLRNQNFSSTIVLELKRTDTGECQCVGVVFDVETSTNEVSRLFFWHKGPLLEQGYRVGNRCMSTDELKDYLQQNFTKEECYYGSHNERFRRQLYDVYLGGLDMEKFPLLFKRAIPFRMNIKLEDFVKEYICTEQDIHIEDMQDSVMQYGRMKKKISDTCEEIKMLEEIHGVHGEMESIGRERKEYRYFTDKMDLLFGRMRIHELNVKITSAKEEAAKQREYKIGLDQEAKSLSLQCDELLKQIAATGYEDLKEQLKSLNELIEILSKSRVKWTQTAEGLSEWADQDITGNSTIWDIEKFGSCTITEGELCRLLGDIKSMREEVREQEREAAAVIRELKRQEKGLLEDLKQLKQGKKAYPKELERARTYIQRRLLEKTGKSVEVEILADLLDIRDDQWRNAVEGYLAGNKLSLIVPPKYAADAMEIYQELDRKEYFRVAVLDTEKVGEKTHQVLPGALSEEVISKNDYVQSYIDFILGKVVKCGDMEALRRCQIGITADCVLYHSYRLQYINPEYYTRSAYIGALSMTKRIKQLEEELETIKTELEPQQEVLEDCHRILNLEEMNLPAKEYLGWLTDMDKQRLKEQEKKKLVKKLEDLKSNKVDAWEQERQEVLLQREAKAKLALQMQEVIWQIERQADSDQKEMLSLNGDLIEREREFVPEDGCEQKLQELLDAIVNPRYDKLKQRYQELAEEAEGRREDTYRNLMDLRVTYTKKYPNRTFSTTIENNAPYDKLLDTLQCSELEAYKKIAEEQAQSAVIHFKDDFMLKIRSAIKDALQRKDELNKIINKLEFGKDKYQFVIGKNKGMDGQYFDMFMDEDLNVDPKTLSASFDNQMNLFTMDHENQYGDRINDLISIFIPPEDADHQQMEEAKHNMDKYADYRTYLSFDMQQIIRGDDVDIKIPLGRMIKKNSGGEGQNPLYVALLASFAQAYRINLSPKVMRNPTIRLVVLDEAFSKMDAEKVGTCIELIRGLGFQAIISATNDKIQNYLESVDKTFVYANPNKKCISIQEFEKKDFGELMEDWDGEQLSDS